MPRWTTRPRSALLDVVRRFEEAGKSLQEAKQLAADSVAGLYEAGELDLKGFSVQEAFDILVLHGREVDTESAMQLAEAVNTSDFPIYLTRVMTPKVLKDYEYWMGDAQELVTVVPDRVSGDFQTYSRITGTEGPELIRETMPYEGTGMGEFEVMIRNNKFGRIMEVSKELINGGKAGEIIRRLNRFSELMGRHRAQMIYECVTGMPSTATGRPVTDNFIVNGTGYNPYATTHASVPGSGSYANRNWYTGLSFTTANLATILTYFAGLVDNRGDYLNIMPDKLLVPPSSQYSALKMFNETQNPNASVAGDSNVYKGAFKPYMWPGFSNSNRFWIGKPEMQTFWQWDWEPKVEVTVDPHLAINNDIVMVIKMSYRGGVGLADHRYMMMIDN